MDEEILNLLHNLTAVLNGEYGIDVPVNIMFEAYRDYIQEDFEGRYKLVERK